MQPIYIPHLTKNPERSRVIQVDDRLRELETLTPVKGRIEVRHRGNFLEVEGQAETIVTLTCHRCLQNYNTRVQVDTSEFIWLQEPQPDDYPEEVEVALDDLVETISPVGHFDPEAWLYEQLCLAIPRRQLCDRDCTGIQNTASSAAGNPLDQRWAALSALKQLPEDNR